MSGTVGGGPPVQIISPRNLPPWLTLLQVLVWIATRNPAFVLRMSLKEREVERANKSLRPETAEWFNPWKGNLLWKAVLWKHVSTEPLLLKSEEAIEEAIAANPAKRETLTDLRDEARETYQDTIDSLLDTLRRGRLTAFATFTNQPPIEMATDAWHSATLHFRGRVFLPFHEQLDGYPSAPVSRWSDAIIECPTDVVIKLWPCAMPWPTINHHRRDAGNPKERPSNDRCTRTANQHVFDRERNETANRGG